MDRNTVIEALTNEFTDNAAEIEKYVAECEHMEGVNFWSDSFEDIEDLYADF